MSGGEEHTPLYLRGCSFVRLACGLGFVRSKSLGWSGWTLSACATSSGEFV